METKIFYNFSKNIIDYTSRNIQISQNNMKTTASTHTRAVMKYILWSEWTGQAVTAIKLLISWKYAIYKNGPCTITL